MTGETPAMQTATTNPYHQDTWELVAEGDWLVGQRFKITRHAVLGRDSSCDITIPGTHLSRKHAELAVKGNALLVRDLNSSNGTFVNGKKITETSLKPGDSIRFDVLRFKIHGPVAEASADNKTAVMRQVETGPKPKTPKPPPAPKHWKTKPTAVGNRDKTIHMPVAKKVAHQLWTVLAVILGLATLAGIGYLVTLL